MIPLMKHAFLNEFETKNALSDFIIKSDKLSMGIECEKFETKFSAFQNRKYSILFNSGGSANLAMIQALKNLGTLKNNDKIGFSALTWSTNVMPIIQMGNIPVPIDCEVNTLNVSSKNLIKTLELHNLKVLFLTNVLGFVDDIENIKVICNERNIILLEDNCESLGTKIGNGERTGNFGLASSFSFFVAHHMSTIEGGMVCTNDEEFSEMLKIVRANGWDRNLSASQQYKWRQKEKITSEFEAKYTFYDLGFNFRPTEITGFLGQYQMQYLDENIKIRESNYFEINNVICSNDDLISLKSSHLSVVSTFALPIICKNAKLREHYLAQFAGAGVEIRPMIAGNIQRQPFYKKYVDFEVPLPNTDFLHFNSFYCGNYPELNTADKEIIKSCLLM
jgi:CDP-6-deoxy-D-xylo-4-hexulose-3-dehydrase